MAALRAVGGALGLLIAGACAMLPAGAFGAMAAGGRVDARHPEPEPAPDRVAAASPAPAAGPLLAADSPHTARATAKPSTAALQSQVDRYLAPYIDLGAFSGAVLVASGGTVLARRAYGMANYELDVSNTVDTKFHLTTASQIFTAAAILLLEERGKLGVEDPLARYLPGYPHADQITIHHLLTHTSGIPDVAGGEQYEQRTRFPHSTQQLVELVTDQRPQYPAGTRYAYSNSNYLLLAYIVERASGQGYGQFLAENLFAPAGMKDSGHDGYAGALIAKRASGYLPDGIDGYENAPYVDWTIRTGSGSLYSTLDDLYRWDRVLRAGTVLSAQSVARMEKPQIGTSGYGWFVNKRFDHRVLAMNGRSPGFACQIERYPDDDACIIVLSNNSANTAGAIAADLAAMMFGEPYETPEVVAPAAVPAAVLDRYVGRYEGDAKFFEPGVVLIVKRQGDQLHMLWSLGSEVTLVPQAKNLFFDRPFWASVRFVADSTGAVTHLVYRTSGQDFVANKVRYE